MVGKEIGDAAQQAWWTAEVIRRIFGPVADDEEGLAISRQMMLVMDPPEHDRMRKLVSRVFTPRAVRPFAV